MRARFAFLTAGDAYEVQVPDATDPHPGSYGAFLYGELPRALVYEPDSHRIDPASDPALIPLAEGRAHGADVAAYRARERPSTIIGFWRVAGGYVHTYMDDMVGLASGCGTPDPMALLRNVLRAVSVSQTRFGPFAAIAAPLRTADPRDPLLRDRVTFSIGGRAAESTLVFRREPGWSREGRSFQTDEAMAEIRITTAGQIAVSAYGPPAEIGRLEQDAATAAASLAPL